MRITVVGVAGCLIFGSWAPVSAQQLAVVPHAISVQESTLSRKGSGNGLDAAISMDLTQVKLATALEEITRISGVQVMYSRSTIPVDQRVTVRGDKITVRDALRQALAGTGADIRLTGEGHVIVAPVSKTRTGAVVQGTIVGKVVHARTKQAVAGATVTVGDAQKGVTTGEDGTFRITVPVGEQTIRVRGVGMTRQDKRITVQDGQTLVIEIVLEPSASVLDEVIVTGTVVATQRKAIPTPITVIHGDELERRGITRIEQLFRGEIPGLFALDRGAETYGTSGVGLGVRSDVYARGSSSLFGTANPLKTYVDGVELQDPSYLGTLDPRSIEKIEIVTGPQAATIYGSGAMGGVMQIFTKRGVANSIPELTLTARYGMLQNNYSSGITPTHFDGISVRGSGGPAFSYAGDLNYSYSGQWQPKLYSRRYGGSLGSTYTLNQLTVGVSYATSATTNGTWNSYLGGYGLVDLWAAGDVDFSTGLGQRGAGGFNSAQVSTTSSQTASLNADYRLTPSWQHHVTVGRSQNTMNLKPVAPNFYDPRGTPVGSDTLYHVQRTNGHRLTWGYNTSYVMNPGWLSSSLTVGVNGSMGEQATLDGYLVNPKAQNIIPDPLQFGGIVARLPVNDQSWGAFGSWQIGLFRQLYTTLGLRAERNPTYGEKVKVDLTPTNGLTYTFEHEQFSVKFMGSYGRATRAPAPHQREESRSVLAGFNPGVVTSLHENADLLPEYSRGPQGGLELYLGNRASVTVNHYQQTITDLIQLIPVDSTYVYNDQGGYGFWFPESQFQNVAKMRQQGWEGTGSLSLAFLNIKGAYSWSDSRILSVNPKAAIGGYRVGETFRNVPTHTGNITIGYAHGSSNFTLATNFVGERSVRYLAETFYYAVSNGRHRMYGVTVNASGSDRIMPGYLKSDFSGSHRLSQQLTLTMTMTNVGNVYDSEVGNLNPSLGRQTMLGVSYRFSR